ncbi:hypothetical protein J6590_065741 [Homalodisca vitripennis]|nr:hypothetical protein J6590_065741 [Homalodisca vitripennis]
MNLYKRGMIFVTFLGSCLGIALVAAALGTKHWVTSRAKRTPNPLESDGLVHLGLFYGDKDLNVAYGWRNYPFTESKDMRVGVFQYVTVPRPPFDFRVFC